MSAIDVHHHIFPATLPKAALSRAVGFRTPPAHLPWSPALSLRAMDALGVELAVLSVPTGHFPDDVRALNDDMRAACVQHPGRFAFWGCAGDLRDTKGASGRRYVHESAECVHAHTAALELIAYALDDLGAVGIAVSSVYGEASDASPSIAIFQLRRRH